MKLEFKEAYTISIIISYFLKVFLSLLHFRRATLLLF